MSRGKLAHPARYGFVVAKVECINNVSSPFELSPGFLKSLPISADENHPRSQAA